MAEPADTSQTVAQEFFILGLTNAGRPFRPSDWAERLCGVMACFQPAGGRNARLKQSPYVRMVNLNGTKAVAVSESLRSIEPMAYHFVRNFAKDNDLQLVEACLLPEPDDAAAGKSPIASSQ